MSNEFTPDPARLAEEIAWLKGYRDVVSDERFLEFVASRNIFLSNRCREYRTKLNIPKRNRQNEQI